MEVLYMFYTRVCEILNIKYPILQGGGWLGLLLMN